MLRLFNEMTLMEKYVTLEGDWSETPAKPGHIVHIMATFDKQVTSNMKTIACNLRHK